MIFIIDAPNSRARLKLSKDVASKISGTVIRCADRPDSVDGLSLVMDQLERIDLSKNTVIDGWVDGESQKTRLRATALTRYAARLGAVRIQIIDNRIAVPIFSGILSDAIPTSYANFESDLMPVIFSAAADSYPTVSKDLRAAGAAGIGAPYPKYIFVGETFSKKHTWRGLPFSGGNDGALLENAFKHIGIGRSSYIMNSVRPSGKPADFNEIMILKSYRKNLRVIALGVGAAKWLNKYGIEHKQVEHPAYVLRYHKDDIPSWILQLRHAALGE